MFSCSNSICLIESGGGGATQKELNAIKKKNEKLTEENNLLKVKIEILLDMVSGFSLLEIFGNIWFVSC